MVRVATFRFETSKEYVVNHRCNRYFFEVTARTAQTATFKMTGRQENYSQFRPSPILPPNDNKSQKIRLHIDKNSDGEYGYIRIAYDLWGQQMTDYIAISA